MPTSTFAAVRPGSRDAPASAATNGTETAGNRIKHIRHACLRTCKAFKEAKTILAALATSVVSVASAFNIDADVVSKITVAIHGTAAHMSENLEVQVTADPKVPPLTIEMCQFDAPGKTMHVAYLLLDGAERSTTEPFVLIRKPCVKKEFYGHVWINPVDVKLLTEGFANEGLTDVKTSITYTRGELFDLDYLLQKSAKQRAGGMHK